MLARGVRHELSRDAVAELVWGRTLGGEALYPVAGAGARKPLISDITQNSAIRGARLYRKSLCIASIAEYFLDDVMFVQEVQRDRPRVWIVSRQPRLFDDLLHSSDDLARGYLG